MLLYIYKLFNGLRNYLAEPAKLISIAEIVSIVSSKTSFIITFKASVPLSNS